MKCETCGKPLSVRDFGDSRHYDDQPIVGLSFSKGDVNQDIQFLIQCWDCPIPNEFGHYRVDDFTVRHLNQKRFATDNPSWHRVRDILLATS